MPAAPPRLVAAIYLFALTGDAVYRNYVDANYTGRRCSPSFWLSPFDAGVTQPLLFYASLPGATAASPPPSATAT